MAGLHFMIGLKCIYIRNIFANVFPLLSGDQLEARLRGQQFYLRECLAGLAIILVVSWFLTTGGSV